jgi:molybdopterin converting factor subunit 1
MNVRIRLFAAARQAAGCDSLDIELPDQADVAQLRRELSRQLPEISELISRATFALGTEYATDTAKIAPGADVALIPPVSGG